jgi:hypothetical protein
MRRIYGVFTLLALVLLVFAVPGLSAKDSGAIVLNVTSQGSLSGGAWPVADLLAALNEEEQRLKDEESKYKEKEAEKRAKLEARLEKINTQILEKNNKIAEAQSKLDNATPKMKDKTRENLMKGISKNKEKVAELEAKKAKIEQVELMRLSEAYQKWNEQMKKKWDNLTQRRERAMELEKQGVKEVKVDLKVKGRKKAASAGE